MGRTGKLNTAQSAHLNTYLDEFIAKLDAGVRGIELTRWKHSVATKALASPSFQDLDVSEIPRTEWFKIIVRKFTNYFNNIYKKTHPEETSTPDLIKSNPLLKFTSVLSGRQLFSRDCQDEILLVAAQRAADTGINEAAAYQIVLKEKWNALSAEEKGEWDSQAKDEAGDVELVHGHSKHNKTNFGGEDLQKTYGAPWAKFADSVLPPTLEQQGVSIAIE
ncbi:hypothetical protein B0H14DRAFT_2557436 [Mycena olivaceomarginata]|nr:hypothetical protein B0H14DRAFT_2557436 [Mycena olivaceomarginata]